MAESREGCDVEMQAGDVTEPGGAEAAGESSSKRRRRMRKKKTLPDSDALAGALPDEPPEGLGSSEAQGPSGPPGGGGGGDDPGPAPDGLAEPEAERPLRGGRKKQKVSARDREKMGNKFYNSSKSSCNAIAKGFLTNNKKVEEVHRALGECILRFYITAFTMLLLGIKVACRADALIPLLAMVVRAWDEAPCWQSIQTSPGGRWDQMTVLVVLCSIHFLLHLQVPPAEPHPGVAPTFIYIPGEL